MLSLHAATPKYELNRIGFVTTVRCTETVETAGDVENRLELNDESLPGSLDKRLGDEE